MSRTTSTAPSNMNVLADYKELYVKAVEYSVEMRCQALEGWHASMTRGFFGPAKLDKQVLDLTMLGLGDNWYVASLFQGSPALVETGRLVSMSAGACSESVWFVDSATMEVCG